jgi:hypothetical protein
MRQSFLDLIDFLPIYWYLKYYVKLWDVSRKIIHVTSVSTANLIRIVNLLFIGITASRIFIPKACGKFRLVGSLKIEDTVHNMLKLIFNVSLSTVTQYSNKAEMELLMLSYVVFVVNPCSYIMIRSKVIVILTALSTKLHPRSHHCSSSTVQSQPIIIHSLLN